MKIRIRKRYLFYVLAFTSAIIAAIGAGIDTITEDLMNDAWALCLSCFIIGVAVSVVFALILSIPFKEKRLGSLIDPSFQGIRLIKKEEIKYHALSGLGNSILTIGYFFLISQFKDPSIVLPFSQIVILYLVVIESITEKNTPTLIEIQSAVIVTFGAILGSLTSDAGSINIWALAIVFLVINPGWVLLSIYQRKLKMLKINKKSNDAINIRLWNVIFAFLFTIAIMFILDLINNTNTVLSGINASFEFTGWLLLVAISTFFGFTLYIRALGIGKASVTQAVRSSTIIFSIPVTIGVSYFFGIGSFESDPTYLLIKFIGITIMLLGIISFALSLTKAYIFIKMKPGYPIEDTMKKLWNISGVNRVTAVAGHYDFIIKIRTRTLVKGYERILRKVQEIPGINSYRWESVLKEWEDI